MAKFLFLDDKIMNIMLEDEKPSGGAAVQAYGWIKGLSEVGQDVHVLTNTNQKGNIKEECKDMNLIPLYDKQKGVRMFRWLYYRLPYLYKKFKQAKPDYLYQGVPGWTSFYIGLICQQLKIKYVMRISNDYFLDDRIYKNHSRSHRFFLWLGLKMAYCILCQNEYQMSVIKREFPNKKMLKISNPFFLKKTGAPSHNQRNYIAWLGLYQYQKNLKLLYEIALQLKEERFFIAGKESSKCDEESFRYLTKLRELPNVKFAGFLQRDEVLPFLAKAKFLLNTSHYEGFSNTFLEAMSVGTPIISSHKVNPDEIISNHHLGIVYYDVSDLIHQYSALTPLTYTIMSENALNYVLNNHDHKLLATKLMGFLSAN